MKSKVKKVNKIPYQETKKARVLILVYIIILDWTIFFFFLKEN